MKPRWIRWFACIVLSLAALCAHAQLAAAANDVRLHAQIDEAAAALMPGAAPHIVFAGFAMHSGSSAFRGDVELAEQVVRAIDPHAVVYKLANPAPGQDHDWPLATRENIYTVLQAIARDARPQDRIVLLFSSHGAAHLLAVQQAYGPADAIDAHELHEWLAPLAGRPVLLLVSACYSGSFLPALRAPTHIVLTAASSTRSSFGCQTDSRNTFFIEELLRQPDLEQRSLVDIVDRAKVAIEQREAKLNLLASQPQSSFGSAVQAWSRQPLADWLAARQP